MGTLVLGYCILEGAGEDENEWRGENQNEKRGGTLGALSGPTATSVGLSDVTDMKSFALLSSLTESPGEFVISVSLAHQTRQLR